MPWVKLVFLVGGIVIGILAAKTHDLDGVKDAWMYRFSVAMMIIRGTLVMGQYVFRLWE